MLNKKHLFESKSKEITQHFLLNAHMRIFKTCYACILGQKTKNLIENNETKSQTIGQNIHRLPVNKDGK